MLLGSLSALCFLFVSAASKSGKHYVLSNHAHVDPRTYLQKIYNYYLNNNNGQNEDNHKSELNYTRWYFSPYEEGSYPSNVGQQTKPPTYIFQNRDRSQLFRKSPEIYKSLKGISVDFFNQDDDNLDPFSHLHKEEENLVRLKPHEVSEEAMFLNIKSVFSQSKRGRTNEKIGTFLYRKLGRYGLVLYLQTFKYRKWNQPEVLQSGVNIIGILPGKHWGTSLDKPFLLTTYWDVEGAIAEDYGSGLAAMVETVRVLMKDQTYRAKYSVIFAAFDKRHDGSVGSLNFVSDYIIPHVVERYKCSLQGVLNLETLLMFSGQNNTQKLPLKFQQSKPSVSHDIINGGRKGNFVAIISRGPNDWPIIEKLRSRLRENETRIRNLEFPGLNDPHQNVQKLDSNIWNNDAGRFWSSTDFRNVPVASLSDTSKYRYSGTLRNILMQDTIPNEISVLKMVTKSIVSIIKDFTAEESSNADIGKIEANVQHSGSIYGILNSFIAEFRNWQLDMERKLADIEFVSRQQSLITANLLQNYRPKLNVSGSSFPYYVLIGDQPTNVESLNNVIDSYYGQNNTSSSVGQIRNSPMVIKLVN